MYRTPPQLPAPAPKTPALRLVWAKIRGVMSDLRVRQERLWLRQSYSRASWDAINEVARDRVCGGDAMDAADNRITLDYEHIRGFYRPGRKDFRARVSREEHNAWKRE